MANEVTKIIVTRDSGNYIGNNSNAIQFPVSSDYTKDDNSVIATTKAVYSAYTGMKEVTGSAILTMSSITNNSLENLKIYNSGVVVEVRNSASDVLTSASDTVSGFDGRLTEMENVLGIKTDKSNISYPYDLTVKGNLFVLGSSNENTVDAIGITTTNVIPAVTGAYKLGNENVFWKEMYTNTAIVNSATVDSLNATSISAKKLDTTDLTAKDITINGGLLASSGITAAGLVMAKNKAGSIALQSEQTDIGKNTIIVTNASGSSSYLVTADSELKDIRFLGNLWGTANYSKLTDKLASARNITISDSEKANYGVASSFDGSSAINITLPNTIKASLDGTATYATVAENALSANSAIKLSAEPLIYIGDSSKTNVGESILFNGMSDVILPLPSSIKANVVGNVTGNVTGDLNGTAKKADEATKLSTSRGFLIADATNDHAGIPTYFDGTADAPILLPQTITADIDGNATTAYKLQTECILYTTDRSGVDTHSGERVSFDGSKSTYALTLPSIINATLDGNAATASSLQETRSIWGQSFDGTKDITGSISNVSAFEFSGVSTTATNGGYIDFHYAGSTDNYTSRIWETSSGTITVAGNLTATKVLNAYYNDYAEFFPRGEETEPGDIIMLDVKNMEEKYIKAVSSDIQTESPIVIGVHSNTYGHIVGGETPPEGEDFVEYNMKSYIPVGLTGRLYVKVTGVVSLGDYIVPSEIPGVGKAWKLEKDPCESIVGRVVHIDQVPDDKSEVYKVKIMIRH